MILFLNPCIVFSCIIINFPYLFLLELMQHFKEGVSVNDLNRGSAAQPSDIYAE